MRLNYKKAVIIGAAGLAIIFTAPQSTLAAATGWQAVNNSWVYIDKDGGRHKGWIKTGDGYYYMDLSTGLMSTGWKKINNKWYYFKSNGIMSTGWLNADNTWYYNLNDGSLVQNSWLKLNDKFYYISDPTEDVHSVGIR